MLAVEGAVAECVRPLLCRPLLVAADAVVIHSHFRPQDGRHASQERPVLQVEVLRGSQRPASAENLVETVNIVEQTAPSREVCSHPVDAESLTSAQTLRPPDLE